jgi:hypothetical protein
VEPSPRPSTADAPAESRGDGTETPPAGAGGVLRIGAVVRLRKPHACGGWEWTVTRAGADVGLACRSCGRFLVLPRARFTRHAREVKPPAEG